jgi:hypothetical protein
MASMSDIRTGLANRLATVAGLRYTSTVPDNPNPPVGIVLPEGVKYDDTFQRGMNTYTLTVMIIVGRADERSAQNKLDTFVSSTGNNSIKLAIEADKTLGGKVFDTRVTELRNYGQITISDVVYLVAEFAVTCYAD